MKVNTEKYIVYSISSVIYGVLMIIVPEIVTNITIFYVSIISSFLGVDIAYTIKETNKLPEGEYKNIKKDRYIVTSIITAILLLSSIIMTKLYKVDLQSSIAVLSATLFLILSIYISGLELNKLFTGKKPEVK